MKRTMQGLLWLFLLEFALLVMSLEPGFLDFDNLPDTNFSCVGKVIGGYYADLETNCQMFHVCTIGQLDEPMDIRFLCLNGTVFDQETRVCERIDEVDCSKSEQFYSLNLELYGNTQPPILEESPENDYPLDSKKSSTTAAPTSTVTPSTFAPFFTAPTTSTTNRDISKVITSHHFPVNSPDLRFNPEEINISLKAGAPPDISRSQIPISYQQQSFSEKNTRVTVTTHTTIYKNEKQNRVPLLSTTNQPLQSLIEKAETTLTPKSVVSYGLTHNQGSPAATPTEINYGFQYPQTEESVEYHTEVPPHPYQYQLNIANFRPPTADGHPYHSSYRASNKRPHKINFPATTYRNHPAFTSSSKTPSYQTQRTEKPPHLQLPLPLLPTLPPLSFSSPSPFSVGHHIETKRYTKDHQSPPRIIISASASVSDNNGRRLNYSLGTIGASHILGSSPASYDDYKEEDVISDPFYHDVPKIKKSRRKRNVKEDFIKNDEEAEDILRYLFSWYKKKEGKAKHISIPVSADDISQINDQLAPISETEAPDLSDTVYDRMFRKILLENEEEERKETKTNLDTTTLPKIKDTITTETNEYRSKTLNRRRNSALFNRNETNKNKKQNKSSNVETELQPTTKNISRRSGYVSIGRQFSNRNNGYYLDNIEKDNSFFENPQLVLQDKTVQKASRRKIDDIEEFQNNFNVERSLETTLEPLNQHTTEQQHREEINNNATTPNGSLVITNYNYNLNKNESKPTDEVNQNNTDTTAITESLSTQTDKPTAEYEYYYEDTTTLSPTEMSFETTDDTLDTTTMIATTEKTPGTTLPSEKSNFKIQQSESQSLPQKEWNKVIADNNIKKTSDIVSTVKNESVKNNLEKESQFFTIPDYVDDNYEPLVYQIDAPAKEHKEITTEKGFKTTTNAVTTNLNLENVTETITDDTVTNTESSFPESLITTQNTKFITAPITNLPTVTVSDAETTLVTDGILTESVTEMVIDVTEKSTETNLQNTFIAEATTILPTVSETYAFTDATQTITVKTTTPTPTTITHKEKNKKDYLRHRFSSYSNRKRGNSKLKNDSLLQVLNTGVNNNNSKLTQKLKNNITVNVSLPELNLKPEPTTLPVDKELETGDIKSEVSPTDAPLLKSANPTKAKYTKILLSTTPLTKVVRVDIRKNVNDKSFIFNCFNKKLHHFYSDPRDCRLFHYCTLGYTRNQLVDMKFVCDLGTYYDEEKFICTKEKPARCL